MGFRVRVASVAAVAIIAALMSAGSSFAASTGAVTTDGRLLMFDTAAPGTLTGGPAPITGLQAGESVLGIDVRPSTGELFALGSSSSLYTIDPATAAATPVGTGLGLTLSGTAFATDFNPTVDRLRVGSDAEQNFRANPSTGAAVLPPDTNLAYAPADPNAGVDPNFVASAYTNNLSPPPASTTVFGIDSGLDALVRLGGVNGTPSPNTGQLFTVGSLGADTDDRTGLDIATDPAGPVDAAYASLSAPGSDTSVLATINLSSGAATPVGQIGPGGFAVRGIAIGVPGGLPPNPPPPDTTSPVAAVDVKAKQKLARVLRRRLIRAGLTCDEACDAAAALLRGGRPKARRAGKVVAAGVMSLEAAGAGTIEVRLTRAGRKYLRQRRDSAAKRTSLTLAVAIADRAQNATSLTRKITLKH